MTIDDDEPSDEMALGRALMVDQREVNARLVHLAIVAQEQHEEAEAAREQAEVLAIDLGLQAGLREQFMGVLGHELRNPLTAIALSADTMLETGRLTVADQAHAIRIGRNVRRMGRMIEQLLDVTRARLSGGLSLTRVPTVLTDVVRHVVGDFVAYSIELEIGSQASGHWDPDRLADVFSNLVAHGTATATPGSVVLIEVDRDGDEAVVTMRYQGVPMSAAMIEAVFQPYRSAVAGKADELGLGLYIANQIVIAHGGRIEVTSNERITAFIVHLPIDAPYQRPPSEPRPT